MALTACKEPSFQGAAGPGMARVIVLTRQGSRCHFQHSFRGMALARSFFQPRVQMQSPHHRLNMQAATSTEWLEQASVPTSVVDVGILSFHKRPHKVHFSPSAKATVTFSSVMFCNRFFC